MAKKGGVQQLQVEINTDEELAKFLDKDGLIGSSLTTELSSLIIIYLSFQSYGCVHRMVWSVFSNGWKFEENQTGKGW